jgi:enamine deaminase RidA (YjgF/YER057c/UK114 family)
MHAETLKSAKYHLKTKQGVSESFYSHSDNNPIYGNGQGAGDSPSQWSQESALLFDLYEESVMGAQLSFQNGMLAEKIPLAAFADDTNLLGNDDRRELNTEQLVDQTKQAFQTWDKLLHALGHFMELGKCACYLSIWAFQPDGYAYTIAPETLNITVTVQDIHGVNQNIQQLSTDASQKILGVMKNPMGNQQDEVA